MRIRIWLLIWFIAFTVYNQSGAQHLRSQFLSSTATRQERHKYIVNILIQIVRGSSIERRFNALDAEDFSILLSPDAEPSEEIESLQIAEISTTEMPRGNLKSGKELITADIEPSLSPIAPSPSVMPTPSAIPSPSPSTSARPSPTPSPSRSPSPSPSPTPSIKFIYLKPPSGKAKSAIFLIHGLEGNATELLPFVKALQIGNYPNSAFILPQAPERYVKLLDDKVSSWFNVLSAEVEGPQDKRSVLNAVNELSEMADGVSRTHDIPRRRMILVGMSQGGALALTSYLRHEWGGAVSLSGYLPISDSYDSEFKVEDTIAPALMIHGSIDEVVPVAAARQSAARIQELGRDVIYIEIEGEGHQLSRSQPGVISAITGLINVALA